MKFYMYNECWTSARTADNWQTFSDSEDDLETIESMTMVNLPQPTSTYVPYSLEIKGMEQEDEYSIFTEFTELTSSEFDQEGNENKSKVVETVGKYDLGQKNENDVGEFKVPRKTQFTQKSKTLTKEAEDNEDVVYLKTVPPPHMIIDLTMDDN